MKEKRLQEVEKYLTKAFEDAGESSFKIVDSFYNKKETMISSEILIDDVKVNVVNNIKNDCDITTDSICNKESVEIDVNVYKDEWEHLDNDSYCVKLNYDYCCDVVIPNKSISILDKEVYEIAMNNTGDITLFSTAPISICLKFNISVLNISRTITELGDVYKNKILYDSHKNYIEFSVRNDFDISKFAMHNCKPLMQIINENVHFKLVTITDIKMYIKDNFVNPITNVNMKKFTSNFIEILIKKYKDHVITIRHDIVDNDFCEKLGFTDISFLIGPAIAKFYVYTVGYKNDVFNGMYFASMLEYCGHCGKIMTEEELNNICHELESKTSLNRNELFRIINFHIDKHFAKERFKNNQPYTFPCIIRP